MTPTTFEMIIGGSNSHATYSFSHLRSPKTGELVAGELRKRIVRGDLPEGAALPSETDLMQQLGISRASLREALRILESETLLTVRRGSRGGAVVQRPDAALAARYFAMVLESMNASLESVYSTRLMVELPALRLVVRNSGGQAPAKLLKVIEAEYEAFERCDIPTVNHHLAQFHDVLVELSGNQTLLLIIRMHNIIYEQQISAIEFMDSEEQRKASLLAIKAQSRLVTYIKNGHEDSTVEFWRTHLTNVKPFLFQSNIGARVVNTA